LAGGPKITSRNRINVSDMTTELNDCEFAMRDAMSNLNCILAHMKGQDMSTAMKYTEEKLQRRASQLVHQIDTVKLLLESLKQIRIDVS
jgi:hypothetical protein